MSHLSGHMRIYGLESTLLSQSRKGFKTDPHPEAPLSRVDVAYNGDNGDNWIMQKKMETTIMGYIGIIGYILFCKLQLMLLGRAAQASP